MDAVVQRVCTSWTKESRGGRQAVRRNAAPTAFLLPPGLSSALHEVSLDEYSTFQPSSQVGDLAASGMSLREVDGLLSVGPPEAVRAGVPRRDWRPPALLLAPGQWLRWQINYRFGGRTNWTYQLVTCNVAYGSPSPEVFLGVPAFSLDERASLR